MTKMITVVAEKSRALVPAALFIIEWCVRNAGASLGGATGKSPIAVWETVWNILGQRGPEIRHTVTHRPVFFLDEYFGAYPSYYHWGWRNLRGGADGFHAQDIHLPRGCFFENGRIVNSDRLDNILLQTSGEWEAYTEPGEKGEKPEIRIRQNTHHAVLRDIRDSLAAYDRQVRAQTPRLQILGIGVNGHIGFVEAGAAARDTGVMLVRLAETTQEANAADFRLRNDDEDVSLEPARHAITQGIATVLSASDLLFFAWGAKKRAAAEQMFLGRPGPLNPAAWVQEHPSVMVYLDQAAFGDLTADALRERGWCVEFLDRNP